jgi:phage tail-like protein
MANREKPYGNYNFQVELGEVPPEALEAGFSEVILPESTIEVITYRSGNAKTNEVMKIPGRVTYSNLILRRGVMGFSNLYAWWNALRNGEQNQSRPVTVSLLQEDRSQVMQWRFTNAWPARLKYGPLLGEGDQVVIEELEITFERMEVVFD